MQLYFDHIISDIILPPPSVLLITKLYLFSKSLYFQFSSNKEKYLLGTAFLNFFQLQIALTAETLYSHYTSTQHVHLQVV